MRACESCALTKLPTQWHIIAAAATVARAHAPLPTMMRQHCFDFDGASIVSIGSTFRTPPLLLWLPLPRRLARTKERAINARTHTRVALESNIKRECR